MVAKPQHKRQEVKNMPAMDYTMLRGRIRDCGMTQKDLAEKAGIR